MKMDIIFQNSHIRAMNNPQHTKATKTDRRRHYKYINVMKRVHQFASDFLIEIWGVGEKR